MPKLPSLLNQTRKRKAEKSYYEFVKQAFENVPSVSKGEKFRDNWHLKILCDKIQKKIESIRNKENVKSLIINVPPGTMKSIMVSKCLVPWVWTWWPQFCYLIVSYSDQLANGNVMVAKDVIASNWYSSNWGNNFSLRKFTDSYIINNSGGHCYSAGIKGTITGGHYHAHSWDDLINPEMAKSEADRLTVIRVMDETLPDRFVDSNSPFVILTQQRISELDPTGHVLEQDPDGWEKFCLPVTDEYPIDPPELSEFYVHVCGEISGPRWLWPEHKGPEVVARMKKKMTIAGFQAQYGQAPTSQDGEEIKKWYWQFYDPKTVTIDRKKVHFFADTAFGKEGKKNESKGKSDFSVCLATINITGNLYITARMKDRLISPLWRPAVGKFIQAHGSIEHSRLFIEPKANGQPQIDELRMNGVIIDGQQVRLNLPQMQVSEAMLNEGKEVRLDSQLSKIEGRRVFLPLGDYEYNFKGPNGENLTVKVAEWVPDFIENCAKFPKGAHDDDIDPLVYALMYNLKQEIDYSKFI